MSIDKKFIHEFIRQHHVTSLVSFFYEKALSQRIDETEVITQDEFLG